MKALRLCMALFFTGLLIGCSSSSGGGGSTTSSSSSGGTSSSSSTGGPVEGVPFAGLPLDMDFTISRNEFFGGTSNQPGDVEFTPEGLFLAASDDATNSFYKVFSSGSRIFINDLNRLRFGNAGWTAGNKGAGTNAITLPDGDMDLSTNYRITIEITDLPLDDGVFQISIDNSTSNSGNSIHGDASLLTPDLTPGGDLEEGTLEVNVPGDILMNDVVIGTIDEHVGTPTSFVAFRCPSNCIDSTQPSDQQVFPDANGIEISSIVIEIPEGAVLQAPRTPPTAPTLTADDQEIGVVASHVGNATEYDIGWSTTDDSGTIDPADIISGVVADVGDPPVSSVTGTITGLTNGELYFVFVRASNTAGDSEWGPSASATPVGDPPAAPAAPMLTAGPELIQAAWATVESATAFDVGWSTTDDSSTIDPADVIEDNVGDSTVITGLTADTLYYVFVRAKNAGGNSDWSPSASATPTTAATAPWFGAALDIFGDGGTEPSGTIDVNTDTAVTISTTGGSVSSSNRRHFFAFQPVTANDFTVTARVVSISTAAPTGNGNSFRFGMMITDNVSTGVPSYGEAGSWGSIGFLYENDPVELNGTRGQMKNDGTQSRSPIADLEAGDWIRIEIFDDGANKRIRRHVSRNDGVDFDQENSTTDFLADAGDDEWFWGFYGAPGENDVTIEFDNITITTP